MKKIKSLKLNHLRWGILFILLVLILISRLFDGVGECYAVYVYPAISFVLSAVASLVPFSLTETVVILMSLLLLSFPFYAVKRMKKNWKYILMREIEILLWVYVWFYVGWGMNYFRKGFHERMNVTVVKYDEVKFKSFIFSFSDSLNASYRVESELSKREIEDQIKSIYRKLPDEWGLSVPQSFQHPKISLVNTLYSKVGVLGYMGPFFAESHVNHDLLPIQYPFTYAHELSHLLGISSEAEANFWAYQVCIHSDEPYIKFCGYFGLLSHVVSNAYSLLPETEFRAWLGTIHPNIIEEYRKESKYWEELYSPFIGAVQNVIYDFYLKGNKIASGRKNYGEVIGLILSVPEIWKLENK